MNVLASLLGHLMRDDLTNPIKMSVRLYVHPYDIRPQ